MSSSSGRLELQFFRLFCCLTTAVRQTPWGWTSTATRCSWWPRGQSRLARRSPTTMGSTTLASHWRRGKRSSTRVSSFVAGAKVAKRTFQGWRAFALSCLTTLRTSLTRWGRRSWSCSGLFLIFRLQPFDFFSSGRTNLLNVSRWVWTWWNFWKRQSSPNHTGDFSLFKLSSDARLSARNYEMASLGLLSCLWALHGNKGEDEKKRKWKNLEKSCSAQIYKFTTITTCWPFVVSLREYFGYIVGWWHQGCALRRKTGCPAKIKPHPVEIDKTRKADYFPPIFHKFRLRGGKPFHLGFCRACDYFVGKKNILKLEKVND